jgi:hypothetical protein
MTDDFIIEEIKRKTQNDVGAILKSNLKIVDGGRIYAPSTHI